MTFNTATILNPTNDTSLSLSHGLKEITVNFEVPSGYASSKPSFERPLYDLVFRPQFGFHLEPRIKPEGLIGGMFDGKYAKVDYMVKEWMSRKAGYPVSQVLAIHDRFETQSQYDALTR